MKSCIQKTQTWKIRETFIYLFNFYYMGLRSGPLGCKLFTIFIFSQLLHLDLDGFKLNKKRTKHRNWTNNMKKKPAKWGSVSPCLSFSNLVGHGSPFVNLPLILLYSLLDFLSHTRVPRSWYAFTTDLGWFYQVIWWMELGFD